MRPALLENGAKVSRLVTRWVDGERLERVLLRDTWVQSNAALRDNLARANELEPLELSDAQVADLMAFLASLTDPSSIDRSELVPRRVPSGLEVED